MAREFRAEAPSAPLGMRPRPGEQRLSLEGSFDTAAVKFFARYNGEPPILSLHDFMSRFERAVVFETLLKTHGNQAETAGLLKVKKQTLNAKVKKQHILITKRIVKEPI